MEAKRYRRSGTYRHVGSGFLMVGCVLLAACASAPTSPEGPPAPSTQGDTSYRAVTKDGMAHYELSAGQSAAGAVPAEHPAPVYPPALLAARLPAQEVEALLIVDTEGNVSDVRIADEAQADPQRRQFDDAVRAVAKQWMFAPLSISEWTTDAHGAKQVSSKTRPFSAAYVFRFAWKDGKPVTGASASASVSH
ncbi:hypothetical protein [Dyella sp. 20L07]|uniref:hypothetical protein n=1 Tax=Dyella sp. 20L07 TaxID=3384240 RepID=UPI003D2BA769